MSPRLLAQVQDGLVTRVIVCDDPGWASATLNGTWIETFLGDATVGYCGPGYGYGDNMPVRFAPQWVQPLGADVDAAQPYPVGSFVFHAGRIWVSTVESNVWEPGVTGWHDAPEVGLPIWVQPLGAHDAYALGARVTHHGQTWTSTAASNVWEPGVYGWVSP